MKLDKVARLYAKGHITDDYARKLVESVINNNPDYETLFGRPVLFFLLRIMIGLLDFTGTCWRRNCKPFDSDEKRGGVSVPFCCNAKLPR